MFVNPFFYGKSHEFATLKQNDYSVEAVVFYDSFNNYISFLSKHHGYLKQNLNTIT